MEATPLAEELSTDIDNDVVTFKMDVKERNKILFEKYEWDKTECTKIWCFGPETSGPNFLCDKTQGT